MPEIILVRQHDIDVTEEELAVARRVIFGYVDGLGQKGQKQWRRLWGNLMRLEPGEMVDVHTNQPRLGPYHRKHMLLESRVFKAQERFDNFDKGFRDWLKVGAGHCHWFPGPKGGVFPVPDSTSYANMEQGAFEEFHHNAVAFLRTDHALKTLWKHLGITARIDMIESILGSMGE